MKLNLVPWKEFKPSPIVGVDEVGRGCLAGPVYAAAACLRSDELSNFLTDSKLISEKRRDELAPLIMKFHWVGIGSASVLEIEQLNILQASLLAMKRAVLELERVMGCRAGHLLIDGNFKIPVSAKENYEWQQTTLVKGDLRCAPISAASIVAKASRDQLMRDLSERFPGYGFEKHKGYASVFHRNAIAKQGPCEIHRKTFSGVKEYGTGSLL